MELEAEILGCYVSRSQRQIKTVSHFIEEGRPGRRYCGQKIKLADSSWFLQKSKAQRSVCLLLSCLHCGVFFGAMFLLGLSVAP